MKQLIIYSFLFFSCSITSFAQDNNYHCDDELFQAAQPSKYSKPIPLDDDHGFEDDSLQIHFDDNEIVENGRAYVYIINTKKHDVFFREANAYQPNIVPIIQEALDSNGNWIPVEYLIDEKNDCIYPQMEFLRPNTYIGFTKKIYKDGDVCTKIRFKFTTRDQVHYSESYEGCVHQCQIDNDYRPKIIGCPPRGDINNKPNPILIYKSKESIDVKITQLKELYDEQWSKKKKELYLKMLISLYRKKKDFETAFSYADKLEKMNTGSGKCHLYKGDLYAMSATECYSNNFTGQHAIVIAAIEEWQKAKQFDDTRKQAEKQIKSYSIFLLERSEVFFHAETYHIGCWINKTVKLWKN